MATHKHSPKYSLNRTIISVAVLGAFAGNMSASLSASILPEHIQKYFPWMQGRSETTQQQESAAYIEPVDRTAPPSQVGAAAQSFWSFLSSFTGIGLQQPVVTPVRERNVEFLEGTEQVVTTQEVSLPGENVWQDAEGVAAPVQVEEVQEMEWVSQFNTKGQTIWVQMPVLTQPVVTNTVQETILPAPQVPAAVTIENKIPATTVVSQGNTNMWQDPCSTGLGQKLSWLICSGGPQMQVVPGQTNSAVQVMQAGNVGNSQTAGTASAGGSMSLPAIITGGGASQGNTMSVPTQFVSTGGGASAMAMQDSCNDVVDNMDGDGLADSDDSGCLGPNPSEWKDQTLQAVGLSNAVLPASCTDGQDNQPNGFKDFDDGACRAAANFVGEQNAVVNMPSSVPALYGAPPVDLQSTRMPSSVPGWSTIFH